MITIGAQLDRTYNTLDNSTGMVMMTESIIGTTRAPGEGDNLQILYFACKYGFYPEGVRVLTQWYNKGLRDLQFAATWDCSLSYDAHEHTFIVTVPEWCQDDIAALVIRLTNRMAKEECVGGDEFDGLKPDSIRMWVLEDKDRENVKGAMGDVNFPIAIRFFRSRKEWDSPVSMVFRNDSMRVFITKKVLRGIMQSTGATLVEDHKQQKVFVAADREDQTLLAVKKLDLVSKFWVDRKSIHLNVFYAERVSEFEVCFMKFPQVQRNFVETTLLDPHFIQDISKDYKRLAARLTVRCAPRVLQQASVIDGNFYMLEKGGKIRPAIHESMKNAPSSTWASFSYAKKGVWVQPDLTKPPKQTKPPQESETAQQSVAANKSEFSQKSEPKAQATLDISTWTKGLPTVDEMLMNKAEEYYDPSLAERLRVLTTGQHLEMSLPSSIGSVMYPRKYDDLYAPFPAPTPFPLVPTPSPLPVSNSGFSLSPKAQLFVSRKENIGYGGGGSTAPSLPVLSNTTTTATRFAKSLLGDELIENCGQEDGISVFLMEDELPEKYGYGQKGGSSTMIAANSATTTGVNGQKREAAELKSHSSQKSPTLIDDIFHTKPAVKREISWMTAGKPTTGFGLSAYNYSNPMIKAELVKMEPGAMLPQASKSEQSSIAINKRKQKPVRVMDSDTLIDLTEDVDPTEQDGKGSLHELAGINIDCMSLLIRAEDLDLLFGAPPPKVPSFGSRPAHSPFFDVERQMKDELSTRKFHSTMNQMAPSKGIPRYTKLHPDMAVIDPSHACMAGVERGLQPMMEQMRNWSGKLTLKSEMGRFIVSKNKTKQNQVYNEDNYNSFKVEHAEQICDASNINFTPMVTTLPAEAQFVLETKNRENGKPMWNPTPKTWPQVRYIFSCKDKKSGSCFEVVMDGETHSYEVQSEPFVFGIVNVHATLRNWDYRVIGRGTESMEEEYGVWAKEFVKSIAIPSNRAELEMTFEIADVHGVEIVHLRVRRECEHPNFNGLTCLHIDQVEDMCVMRTSLRGKAIYWIKPFDEKMNPPKTFTRKWYEFSVSSTEVDKAFLQNQCLEVGQLSIWTFEWLHQRTLLWNVCNPVSEVLQQCDGVGWWNIEARPDSSSTPRPPGSQSPSEMATTTNYNIL